MKEEAHSFNLKCTMICNMSDNKGNHLDLIKCSVLPESCSVPSGIYVQFVLETSFRLTGICNSCYSYMDFDNYVDYKGNYIS